ncbi:MAG: hypothetical protein HKN26_06590 [Acidimicrobiales bacterium]|nr:hypothetical protein [Acidimicrobiales bacterium]
MNNDRNRFLRGAVATLVALGALLASAAPAGAQYGGTPALVVNPPVILPGGEINAIGSGCGAGETVIGRVEVVDIALGSIVADSNGDFVLADTPVDAPPGIYPVTFTCELLVLAAELTVVDPEDAEEALRAIEARRELEDGLAFTGSDLSALLPKVGAVLITLGALFLAAGRRRRTDA